MTETPKKKTAAKKSSASNKVDAKKAASGTKAENSSFLPFDLPKVELPKFDIPKFDIPKFDLPKIDLPKIDLPKIELPTSATEAASRGRDFVTDSVKSARTAAGSVRKNVSETVVLVREAVGV